MGMSASQVRYLTLTARIHDVENEAQRIQNQKLLLANDSDEVYQRYLDALNKTKIQVRQFNDDSGVSQMVDVTLDVLYRESCSTTTNGYMLTGIDGSLYLPFAVDDTTIANFNNFEQACARYFYPNTDDTTSLSNLRRNSQQSNYVIAMWKYINDQAGTDYLARIGSSYDSVAWASGIHFPSSGAFVSLSPVSNDTSVSNARLSVIHCITDASNTDTNWLRDIIGYGYANFQMLSGDTVEIEATNVQFYPGGGSYDPVTMGQVSWDVDPNVTSVSMHYFNSSTVATDTQMGEAADDIELAVAEVEYESDMKKINAKDKKYDTELSTLENQRSAMKEEMDSLKTVINDNIQRTFKLFS